MMTEQEFLELCRSKYQEINKLNEIKDFYQYEKQFDQTMVELSRMLLERNLSQVPVDRRKKNTLQIRENRDCQCTSFQRSP